MALILKCDVCDLEEEMDRNGNTTLYLTMTDGSQVTNTGISGLIVDLCANCKRTTSAQFKDRMREQLLKEIAEKPKKMFGGRNVTKGESDTF